MKVNVEDIILCLYGCLTIISADYTCVCNYDVENAVLDSPTVGAQKIGYLYEFDCKEEVPLKDETISETWFAFAFNHQTAYVKKSASMQISICTGDPSPEDKLTTSATTTPQLSTSTSVPSTSTPQLATSTSSPSTTTSAPPVTSSTAATTREASTATTPSTTASTVATTTIAPSSIASTTVTPKVTTPITTSVTEPKTMPTTGSTSSPTTVSTTSSTLLTTTVTPLSTSTIASTEAATTSTTLRMSSTQTQEATTKSPSTTSSTTTASLSTSTTTTTSGSSYTTDISRPDGNTRLCQGIHLQHASDHSNSIGQYGAYCYEILSDFKMSWQHGEDLCQSGHGHLVSITSAPEQAFVQGFMQRHMSSHAIWIGLHDTKTENVFEWTSGDKVSYTNWMSGHLNNFQSHYQEDCVAFIPYQGGTWDDVPCGFGGMIPGIDVGEKHYAMCKFDAQSTLQTTAPPSLTTLSINNMDGNTNLCTNQNKQHAIANGNVLAQYGSHCFELMSHVKVSWLHGESLCQSSQGHLLQIKSAEEQTFIDGFMQSHMPDHAVWIGLHDRHSESYFEWTTGERVSYTNWIPAHTNNFLFHEDEDCVVLVPYKGGQWDDIPCGGSGMFLQDRGETHPIICQYDIISGPSLIG